MALAGVYAIEYSRARLRSGWHVAIVWKSGEIVFVVIRSDEAAAYHIANNYVSRAGGKL